MEEPREVSIEDGIAYAKQENMDFTETSALTGYCVEQMFRRITLLAARKIVEVRDNIDLSSLPDGWLAIYDYEEGFHSIGSESRLKSIDSSRTTNPAKSSLVCSGEGDTANYTSENPVQQLPAALVTKVRYMNYWTGEIAPAEDYKEFPPATPALPGLIHVIDPSSPVASRKKRSKNDGERGSESSRASNTT